VGEVSGAEEVAALQLEDVVAELPSRVGAAYAPRSGKAIIITLVKCMVELGEGRSGKLV